MNLQRDLDLPHILPLKEHSSDTDLPKLTQKKLIQAIETISMGFIQINFNWKIMYWNSAAEKFTGYKKASVLNKNLFDVITEMNYMKFYNTWQKALKNQKTIQFCDYFWPTQKWFEFSLYSNGEDIIIHFHDVTKKYATRKTLLKKINLLKEISFFNSHVIRKPLANLLGLVHLLDRDIKIDDFKEYAFHIGKSAKKLDEMIRSVNIMADEESYYGNIYAKLEHFSFKDMLTEIKDELTTQNNEHHISTICSSVIFYGNRDGIESCIKALTFNAIKHSADSLPIKINIKVKDNNFYIMVQDFGNGIPKQTLVDIHATLVGSRSTSAKKKFTEISNLCLEHNGSFWIESDGVNGTKAFMLLPLSNLSNRKQSYVKKLLKNSSKEAEIIFDPVNQCLHIKWEGYFDGASVKKNYHKINEAMKNYQCFRIISNETNLVGANINCIKWVIKYGFNLLQQAGLSHFAWVHSKNEFGKLSAIHVCRTLDTLSIIKHFPDYKHALAWLTGTCKINFKS